ncbi:TetR/AcrR family transcriptional regulator [Mycobacterium paraffinicum]|uniref:TetR/AcrR family transcriptional regulator n=1 Tax=Mycobacterium paraffinicum TaxID=53378 RepID=UPI001ABF51FE
MEIGANVSLRVMADALGVTHATLIRHFTSKSALLAEVVEHVRVELLSQLGLLGEPHTGASTATIAQTFWARLADPRERRQFLVMTEIYALAVRDRRRFTGLLESLVYDFVTPIANSLMRDGMPSRRATAVATALLAQIRGLQLDLAATGDHDRVDEAFAVVLESLL